MIIVMFDFVRPPSPSNGEFLPSFSTCPSAFSSQFFGVPGHARPPEANRQCVCDEDVAKGARCQAQPGLDNAEAG